ncbi:hypothetical protein BJX99DRAFT_199970 [Aspergillus californicus]
MALLWDTRLVELYTYCPADYYSLCGAVRGRAPDLGLACHSLLETNRLPHPIKQPVSTCFDSSSQMNAFVIGWLFTVNNAIFMVLPLRPGKGDFGLA